MNKKSPYGTIDFNGKKVPLTKDGLPNLVNLPKSAREVVKKYKAQKTKAQEEILMKELQSLLEKI